MHCFSLLGEGPTHFLIPLPLMICLIPPSYDMPDLPLPPITHDFPHPLEPATDLDGLLQNQPHSLIALCPISWPQTLWHPHLHLLLRQFRTLTLRVRLPAWSRFHHFLATD